MKLSAMKVDPALTEQGDWVENIPDLPGIRIKARGTNNSDYRALEAKLVREIPRAERIEGVSPKEQDRIAGQLLLQTVVLDVEGLEDDDGNPLAYTRELGAKFLLDPEFRVFQAGAAYAAAIRRRAAADAALRYYPLRSAFVLVARMGGLRPALDRSAGRADAWRDSMVVD